MSSGYYFNSLLILQWGQGQAACWEVFYMSTLIQEWWQWGSCIGHVLSSVKTDFYRSFEGSCWICWCPHTSKPHIQNMTHYDTQSECFAFNCLNCHITITTMLELNRFFFYETKLEKNDIWKKDQVKKCILQFDVLWNSFFAYFWGNQSFHWIGLVFCLCDRKKRLRSITHWNCECEFVKYQTSYVKCHLCQTISSERH